MSPQISLSNRFQKPSSQLSKRSTRPAASRRQSFQVVARIRSPKWWPESWDSRPETNNEQQTITFFCADGTVTRIQNRPMNPSRPPLKLDSLASLPAPVDQGLCIGSVFNIVASNGIDTTRRVNLLGFCQSVEYLHEVVEMNVMQRGGEIFDAERKLKNGISECLTMTVALPFLFGIPAQLTYLRNSIKQGGGVLHNVQKEWWIV